MSIVDLEYSMTNFVFLTPKLIADGDLHFQKRNLGFLESNFIFLFAIWNFSVEVSNLICFLVSNLIFRCVIWVFLVLNFIFLTAIRNFSVELDF